MEEVLGKLKLVDHSSRGRLHTLVVRGSQSEVEAVFDHVPMTFLEILPLTLEEIFIAEAEALAMTRANLSLNKHGSAAKRNPAAPESTCSLGDLGHGHVLYRWADSGFDQQQRCWDGFLAA